MKAQIRYMKKLLEGVEVEWKTLGEVASLRRGRVISKSYLMDNAGDYPVYSSQTIKNGKIGSINTFDFEGESISWTTDGANAGTVFYRTGKFSITNVCGLLKIKNSCKILYRFLFYWLSIEAKKHVYTGMGNPKLMSHQVEKIEIPIPPLHIQNKIIQLLDRFTAMTAELTAELTVELAARKKQYNYYREKLLQFGPEVERKPLGEVASLRRGRVISKSYLMDNAGDYPVYSSQTIKNGKIGSINTFDFEGESISWTTDGANAGTVFYRTGKFSITNVCGLLKIKNSCKILYRFLFYWLSIEAKKHVYTGMGNPKLMSHQVEKIEIPIPPLSEQKRIVAILDKFDALAHSISEGLPREIELRQKEYVYYREMLLNFPNVE